MVWNAPRNVGACVLPTFAKRRFTAMKRQLPKPSQLPSWIQPSKWLFSVWWTRSDVTFGSELEIAFASTIRVQYSARGTDGLTTSNCLDVLQIPPSYLVRVHSFLILFFSPFAWVADFRVATRDAWLARYVKARSSRWNIHVKTLLCAWTKRAEWWYRKWSEIVSDAYTFWYIYIHISSLL